MHLAGEEGSTPEPAGRGQFFQKLQQQMALGHQPNTHSAAEANLAACKPWLGSPWCILKLYLDFLVPHRTHFVPALQSAWIGSGAVISCLITLSAWHCNSTLTLGNSGLGMVSMSWSPELDPLWNECWGQGELMGEEGTWIMNQITAWTMSQLLWSCPKRAEERKQIKSTSLWKFPSSLRSLYTWCDRN